ncbi:MAG: DUF3891 family protein [Verrucomicrobia bacterium]|nr:DUF3891 family protein [Verrucomicrobiota bacterium]
MIISPKAPEGKVLVISQVSHSWISGQLARMWGNKLFQDFEPREEVCYAATQHDIGFLKADLHPEFNTETGLPYSFEELPESVHLDIWRASIYQLWSTCCYASLIVSSHFYNLCRRFHSEGEQQYSGEANRFLNEQSEFQSKTLEVLRSDRAINKYLVNRAVHIDQLAIWDLLSLRLCQGRLSEFELPSVPIKEKQSVVLHVIGRDDETFSIEPWPFSLREFSVVGEGRLLDTPTNRHMLDSLGRSQRKSIRFKLVSNAS